MHVLGSLVSRKREDPEGVDYLELRLPKPDPKQPFSSGNAFPIATIFPMHALGGKIQQLWMGGHSLDHIVR
jgi:hypothetical protein